MRSDSALSASDDAHHSEPGLGGAGRTALACRVALNLARQLADLPPEAGRSVLLAVRARLANAPAAAAASSMNALRRCQAEVGRLSKSVYEAWRSEQAYPEELPTSRAISAAFGSWKLAMVEFGHVVIDPRSSELTPDTRAFTAAELVACVRAYAATGQPLTVAGYLAWAHDQMARTDRDLPRVFLSLGPIYAHFGRWRDLIASAGLIERLDEPSRRSYRGSKSDYSYETCVEWVARAAAALPPGTELTCARYDSFVRAVRATADGIGPLAHPPSIGTVRAWCKTWADALAAAGLIDAEELELRRGHRTTFISNPEILEAVRAALAELAGRKLTLTAYERWRAPRVRRDGERLASSRLIRSRFGSLANAIDRARA